MPTQIEDELEAVYGDSAQSFTTGQLNLNVAIPAFGDNGRLEHPKTTTTDNNITKVQRIMLNESQNKIRKIAEAMNISKYRICQILNQDL